MRFVYIDSQGTEVEISSVEALQLRIELGAITEETMFYDQSADRWAPAGEHEVFRSVSREVRSLAEDRPEAPPSDSWGMPSPSASSADPPPSAAADAFNLADDADPDPPRPTEEVFTVGTDGGEWPENASQPLEDTAIGEVTAPEGAGVDPGDLDLGDPGELELAPDLGAEEVAPQDGWAEPDLRELPDFSTGLELEPPLSAQDDLEASSTSDFGLDIARSEDEVGQAGPSFGFPADLEQEARAEAPSVESVQEAGPHPFDDHPADPETSSAHGQDEEPRRGGGTGGDPYERRPRRPGSKAPPQRGRAASHRRVIRTVSPVVVVAALGLVGVGGWFGVRAFLGGEEDVVVTIPDIPAELEAPMREVAAAAFSQMLDSLGLLADRVGIPEEPNEDWLSGLYLANPGRFDDVLEYWQRLGAYLDQVREIDGQFFRGALETAISETGLDPEASDAVFARADAGFLAARPSRRRVYDLLEDLITASAELHEFLLAHEGQIKYQPASGISTEPVTEVVASDPGVNDRMWDHVLRITNALDALGTLERVTTERILEVFRRRLEMVAGS